VGGGLHLFSWRSYNGCSSLSSRNSHASCLHPGAEQSFAPPRESLLREDPLLSSSWGSEREGGTLVHQFPSRRFLLFLCELSFVRLWPLVGERPDPPSFTLRRINKILLLLTKYLKNMHIIIYILLKRNIWFSYFYPCVINIKLTNLIN